MKVSFITTVLNEEKSIKDLLDSLLIQTKKPDQVIIVDAGSTDRTLQLIKLYQQKLNIKLVRYNNANRSQGRNKAITLAKHPIIAISDAGCTLDKNWLKIITKPFKNTNIDSVAGFYKVKAGTVFQQCLAPFVATLPSKLDQETYLPSSRSVAFKKTAIKKSGLYPENLNYCEDLIFANNLKTKTRMKVEPRAIVYWHLTNNLINFFHQIKNYTYGDIRANYLPHKKKILSIYSRYLVFLLIPLTLPFYLGLSTLAYYKYVQHPLALIYLPIIRVIVDLGMILGSIKGKIDS